MDGIEKIIDRISGDAQREVDDVLAQAKAEAEEEAANSPVEVNVVRREKKQRQHKKN